MFYSLLIVFLAAALASVNVPFSKFILPHVSPMLLGSLTFLGAAFGTGIITLVRMMKQKKSFKYIRGRDWLSVVALNVCDTAANIMLFYGISLLNGETASLLQSFETVATAIVAFLFFKEKPSWRLLIGIAVVLGASVLLSFNPGEGFAFNAASLLIIGATVCWGFDNNFMKKVSERDTFEFSFFKTFVPGLVILVLALATDNYQAEWAFVGYSLLDGFVAYGLSVALLAMGFRKLSASLGTAVYATNPFLGAILSLIFFPSSPSWTFYVSLALMLGGEAMVAYDAITTEKKEKEKAKASEAGILKP